MTMLTRSLTFAAVALVTATSCTAGGWSRRDRTMAYGGQVQLLTDSSRVDGELLLADETGVVVLSSQGVASRAPWEAVSRISFEDRPVGTVEATGGAPDPVRLRQIQLASRYPYGLTDAQVSALLESLGQRELRAVR